MPPPLARTSDEAHLYMELHPCACGEPDFGATSAVSRTGDGWLVRYAGTCVECGRSRSFEFRQPEELAVPAEDAWADGDRPSELLDAGEWLYVADTYGDVPLDAVETQRRTDLLAAAAAVTEVLKFLPDGAGSIPATAFWSHRGREVRDAEPGRFRRERLLAARDAYRAAV